MPADESSSGVRPARPTPRPEPSTSPMGALLASCAAARAVSTPPVEEPPTAAATDREPPTAHPE